MLVVSRFIAEPGAAVDELSGGGFVARAHTALATLAAQRGYVAGRLGRAMDDPHHWCLVTEWASVGAYRRALSSYEVKLHATPLLAESIDEPSAYEVLASAEAGGVVEVAASDLAQAPDELRSRS
jgi:heme oxygenase (mycobilin-producing)